MKIFRIETDLCLQGASLEGQGSSKNQDMPSCELTTFTTFLTVTMGFKMLVNLTKITIFLDTH